MFVLLLKMIYLKTKYSLGQTVIHYISILFLEYTSRKEYRTDYKAEYDMISDSRITVYLHGAEYPPRETNSHSTNQEFSPVYGSQKFHTVLKRQPVVLYLEPVVLYLEPEESSSQLHIPFP
jgi:hypothetical protein